MGEERAEKGPRGPLEPVYAEDFAGGPGAWSARA